MMNFILLLIIVLSLSENSWGWDDKDTHPRITQFAINQYFDSVFLKESLTLGTESKRSELWIQEGSTLEDVGKNIGYVTGSARSLYHFHDPTKPLGRNSGDTILN